MDDLVKMRAKLRNLPRPWTDVETQLSPQYDKQKAHLIAKVDAKGYRLFRDPFDIVMYLSRFNAEDAFALAPKLMSAKGPRGLTVPNPKIKAMWVEKGESNATLTTLAHELAHCCCVPISEDDPNEDEQHSTLVLAEGIAYATQFCVAQRWELGELALREAAHGTIRYCVSDWMLRQLEGNITCIVEDILDGYRP